MSCDPTRPERESCDEFPVLIAFYYLTTFLFQLLIQLRRAVATSAPQPIDECPICPPGPQVFTIILKILL